LETKYLNLSFADCPVETSLGILGKKWKILIVRDIGVYGRDRFSRLQVNARNPPKVLASRLKQLEQEGLITKYVEKGVPPKVVRWSLTEKGLDVIRIGMMFVAFGSRWYPDRVFDEVPGRIHAIFNREGMELLMKDF
jgi:DNA-binding HxlR family transcriptional regulator